jgi:uncharacterized protein YaaN involved in tellurite resistance
VPITKPEERKIIMTNFSPVSIRDLDQPKPERIISKLPDPKVQDYWTNPVNGISYKFIDTQWMEYPVHAPRYPVKGTTYLEECTNISYVFDGEKWNQYRHVNPNTGIEHAFNGQKWVLVTKKYDRITVLKNSVNDRITVLKNTVSSITKPYERKTTMSGFTPVATKPVTVKEMAPVQSFVPAIAGGGKEPLPPVAQKEVAVLLSRLQVSTDFLDYGKDISVKLSTYADQMLEKVQLANVDEFTKPLTDVLVLCANVNSKTLTGGNAGRLPWVRRLKEMFATQKVKAMSQFNSVKEQIDDIIKQVDTKETSFRGLIKALEDLYVLNMNDYYMLEAHIRAAEEFQKQKQAEHSRFMSNNAETMKTNPLVSQQANDIQRLITKIDRKLYDLRAIQMSCVQFAPQIRREQDTAERLIEKFGAIKTFAIPLWKKQCVAYISSLENQSGIALANKADSTTDALYRGHMDTVNANATESAKALESGIISVETLEYANQSLIQSIQDVLGIVEEGTKTRAAAIPRITNMKEQILTNVIATQNGPAASVSDDVRFVKKTFSPAKLT